MILTDKDVLLIVENDVGRQFSVRVVNNGDRYGLDGRLTHAENDPLVEFYDRTYAGKPGFAAIGQFVTRYNLTQLLTVTGGLCLDGGVPVWTLDRAAVRHVLCNIGKATGHAHR